MTHQLTLSPLKCVSTLRWNDIYIEISKLCHHRFKWNLLACFMLSHYWIQCWIIVNWTLGNKFYWNLNQMHNLDLNEWMNWCGLHSVLLLSAGALKWNRFQVHSSTSLPHQSPWWLVPQTSQVNGKLGPYYFNIYWWKNHYLYSY